MSVGKGSLDRISEGSESLTSKSEPTYKEKVRSLKDLTSESFTISKEEDEKTEEISEEIISAASEEKAEDEEKENVLRVDLSRKPEDLYDVSVQDDGTYSEDFVSDVHTNTRLDKLNQSTRSVTVMSEDVESKTAPHSARSVAEPVTEQISENLPSMAGDESFSHKIDLGITKQADDFDGVRFEQDNESDLDKSVYSSRPSSGKSERSTISLTEHESSESEKSPKVDLDLEKAQKTKLAGVFNENVLDIDDLLGPPDELTPLPSEQSTPNETPRLESEASRSSNFYEPLSDFNIGDQVSVTGPTGDRVMGTLLFRGNVKFAPGVWAGVELENPEGRHNGVEDGVRYFTCKDKHGLIVPGHDLRPVGEEGIIEEEIDVRESISSLNTDDGELQAVINEAAKSVEILGLQEQLSAQEQELEDRNILADRITNDLFESVIKQDLSTISNIASNKHSERKKGPPVAPKPKKPVPVPDDTVEDEDTDADRQQAPEPYRNEHTINETTDSTVTNFMNDAIEEMIEIRKKKSQAQVKEEDNGEEDDDESPASPTEEIEEVIDKKEEDKDLLIDVPFRPGSPVPGLQSQTVSIVCCTDRNLCMCSVEI